MKEAVVALILVCLMALGVVCVLPVKAQYEGAITINADGSVSPSTAPIQVIGSIYILTSDIDGSITVNRNNMVFDGNGYTLTYFGGNQDAFELNNVSNDTVRDLTINTVEDPNNVGGWGSIDIIGNFNVIANNTIIQTGISLLPEFTSEYAGISICGDSNIITGNVLANNMVGIDFFEGENNIVVGNTIENSSSVGIMIWGCSNNTIYHNNFINSSAETADIDSANPVNVWDAGYPLGGNYWSDYQKRYPSAAEIDDSGIGDTTYVLRTWYRQLDFQNQDRYPLMEPYTEATYLRQTTPPTISVLSPNPASVESNVSLVFTVDKLVDWMGYSLDGQQNVTVTGNVTLAGLSSGLHSITVYANDTYGNMGASEAVAFTVPETFPVATAFAASGVITAVFVGAGIVLYYKRRRRKQLFS